LGGKSSINDDLRGIEWDATNSMILMWEFTPISPFFGGNFMMIYD
jgi:hypothetical protein